eukprot:TRINITY_DN14966_c0_g1_i3.p1 TRINITY_DN14966_c0_g1~~TRINITY_DN14966_c0_g1_i3.p1  ORF type:complete len:170 (+),score=32.65 TRINITY_DN14966_c0_g1_i3:166-675(+)
MTLSAKSKQNQKLPRANKTAERLATWNLKGFHETTKMLAYLHGKGYVSSEEAAYVHQVCAFHFHSTSNRDHWGAKTYNLLEDVIKLYEDASAYTPKDPGIFAKLVDASCSFKEFLPELYDEFCKSSLRRLQKVAPLPEGWDETIDPTGGRPYYWKPSDKMNTRTWKRPF